MKTPTVTPLPGEANAAPLAPQRRLASAALLVMIFFLLSRIMGLVREMVVAAHFGASAELDAYLAAFRVPDLLFQLVAGGALGSAFIPTFAGYWTQGDTSGAWLLFSRVLNLVTLLLTVVAAVAALFAEPLVRYLIAPGFAPDQALLTANLMRWMLVSTVLFGASGLVMGALNAVQHFLLPAAAPVLYNLAIIAGAWWLTPAFGVYGLALGVVIGAMAHLLVQLPGLWQARARYRPSFAWRDAGVGEVVRLMGPRALGLFFVQMHFLVNTILASGLSAGSLAALNYGWLLMLLPQGIFAQSLATAAFPTLAALAAAGQLGELRHTFSRTLRLTLFLTLPSAVGLLVLSRPLVGIVLERGAFDPDSTQRVAYALQLYAVGLVGHAVLEIVVRAFYALHDTWTPVKVGVAAMGLNIGLSVLWVERLGYGGLALANSCATTIEALALLWLLHRQLHGFEARRIAQALGRQALAALVMAGALWLWLAVAPAHLWLRGGGGLLIGVGVYGGAALFLHTEELQPAVALVSRRLSLGRSGKR
jgi:putative peptidoglycan lipid II flippase